MADILTIGDFSGRPKPESGSQIDAARPLSGRVRASKLNRLTAVDQANAATTTSTAAAAATRQSAQLPAFAPLLEELEVAGWSSHRRTLSGNFHDWALLENRTLLVVTGQAVAAQPSESIDAIEAALVAQGGWAAIRAHAQHVSDAGTLLSLAARSLWSNVGVGLQVAVALIDLEGGHTSVAVAGDCLALRVRAASSEQIATRQPVLGSDSDFSYLSHSVQLAVRERIVLVADEPLRRPEKFAAKVVANFARLDAEAHRRMMAADAIGVVRDARDEEAEISGRPSASIVAVRRR